MERRIVPVQPKVIATISVLQYDKYAHGGDFVTMEQASRNPVDEHVRPDESAPRTGVPWQKTILKMSQAAVLVNCDGTGMMCVKPHPNLNRQRSASVARKVPEIMRRKPFYIPVPKFSEMKIHLPKGMIVAQGSFTMALMTNINNEYSQGKTVNDVPMYKSKAEET